MSEEDNVGETLLDMDDLADLTLDGVEEAPEFMVPPSGKYRLGISKADIVKKEKDGEEKTSLRIIYFTKETVELASQDDDQVPNGSLFSENFQVPEGLKYFKPRMKKLLGDGISGISIKDMLEFLPTAFGEEGDKTILTTLRKTISKSDAGEFENVRFQKMEVEG